MKLVDLDKKIPTLNNLSLREVFESGAINENTTRLFQNGTLEFLTPTKFKLTNLINNPSSFYRISFTLPYNVNLNDKLYRVFDVIERTDLITSFYRVGTSGDASSSDNTTTLGRSSYVNVADFLFTRLQLTRNNIFTTPNSFTVDNLHTINLTALGIASLTKAQMDAYYELYQSGVQATGFVQKTSKNLFDGKFEKGAISIDSGINTVSDNFSIRNIGFIKINANTSYTYSNSLTFTNNRFFWYNSNFNYISYIQANTATSPSNAAYVRFRTFSSVENSLIGSTQIQLELGSTATAYQPYRPFAIAKGIDEVAYSTKTYREIFEGGDKSNIAAFTSGINFDYSYFTNSGVPAYFETSASLANQKIYIYNKGKVIGGNGTGLEISFRSYTTSLTQISQFFVSLKPTDTNITIYSDLITLPSNAGAYGIRGGGSLPNNTYDMDLKIINLTSLFGSGNEPDKATMDRLFQQYQEGGTIQAQAFIQTAGKDTRVIDAKLPHLNMMSIREVFESAYYEVNQPVNVSGTFNFTTDTPSLNNEVYYIVPIATIQSGTIQFFTTQLLPSNVINNRTINSFIIDVGSNTTLRNYWRSATNLTATLERYLINLTALNLTHLTQAELDAMFALYEAGTLKLSDVFETGNLVNWGGTLTSSFTNNAPTSISYTKNDAQAGGGIVTVTNENANYYQTQTTVTSGSLTRLTLGGGSFANALRIAPFELNTTYSLIFNASGSTVVRLYVDDIVSASFKDIYLIRLNTHNLQATTKTFMDDLFKAYQRYKSPLFIDKNGVAYGTVFISKGGA